MLARSCVPLLLLLLLLQVQKRHSHRCAKLCACKESMETKDRIIFIFFKLVFYLIYFPGFFLFPTDKKTDFIKFNKFISI
jgi:hypothetical protein